ncbi:T9SS C-terminal target domain-containing protein [Dysgonomonas sp. 216]|uniref:T9SS type A sorting domain-containing protein n=1 Tax=Dysgonomonas sp. 216 TaxID=2302934 RepID=UPI0013D6404D|nr:T9SS type A sorting domain-containing protein [Dysgonomonas sp. 216]NDW18450.1 T9SS C-terminal target domain-containing protein [Dysgonomonas sp. 216]
MKSKFLPLIFLIQILFTVPAYSGIVTGSPIESISKIKAATIKAKLGSDKTVLFSVNTSSEGIEVSWGGVSDKKFSYPTSGINQEVTYTYGSSDNVGDEVEITIYCNVNTLFLFNVIDQGATSLSFESAGGMNGMLNTITSIDNPVSSLEVSNLTALQTLNCYAKQNNMAVSCKLTSLDVSSNTNLVNLILNDNELLTSVKVSDNAFLSKLNLNDCPRLEDNASLLSSSMVELTEFSAANSFTAVNIPSLPKLNKIELACSGSKKLTSLTVGNCPQLSYVACSGNSLTSLDLSGCPSLQSLKCSNNQLSTLEVSTSITTMDVVDCSNNKLGFGTFPQVGISTSFDYSGQVSTAMSIVENPAYTIKLDLPTVRADYNPRGVASPVYKVSWFVAFGGTESFELSEFGEDPVQAGKIIKTPNKEEYYFTPDYLIELEGIFGTLDGFYAEVYNTGFGTMITQRTEQIELNGSSVGINPEGDHEKVGVYPNPFAEELKVRGGKGSLVRVVNLSGVSVYTTVISSDSATILLTGLPSGVYFVVVDDSGVSTTHKVIKK